MCFSHPIPHRDQIAYLKFQIITKIRLKWVKDEIKKYENEHEKDICTRGTEESLFGSVMLREVQQGALQTQPHTTRPNTSVPLYTK